MDFVILVWQGVAGTPLILQPDLTRFNRMASMEPKRSLLDDCLNPYSAHIGECAENLE